MYQEVSGLEFDSDYQKVGHPDIWGYSQSGIDRIQSGELEPTTHRFLCTIASDRAEIARLREALGSIANDPHCSQYTHDSDYQTGVEDGHRCAAEQARNVLAPQEATHPQQ